MSKNLSTWFMNDPLEYGLLLVGSGRFMIYHIEGRSNTYYLFVP